MLALYSIVATILAVIDQLSKLAVIQFVKPARTIPLWKDVFHLTYCENRGAAFGILQNAFFLFFIITVLVVVGVTVYLVKTRPKSRLLTLSLALLVGGALGNFIDRLFRGFVVDFFDFRLINFAIFNFADCCVVCGACLLAFYVIFLDKKQEEKDETNDESDDE